MNLKHLSDEALLSQTKGSVSREREMTLLVLHHLKEVERRRLFATLGYSSLFDYATRELGYCAAAACRRIDAMRLLKEMPKLEEKVQEGKLTLSTLARAQSFFKKEKTALNRGQSTEQKIQLMESLENKSTREVERELILRSSQPEVHFNEKVKPITAELSEVRVYLSDETLRDLDQLKGLLAHSYPNMTTAELIGYLAKLGLEKLEPSLHENKRVSPGQDKLAGSSKVVSKRECLTPAPNDATSQSVQALTNQKVRALSYSQFKPRSRYVPRNVIRAIWRRDASRCAWVSPQTGKRCEATYRLQIDHVKAYALGGSNTYENLRLLCFHHNQFESERIFGRR
jgi:5-methylcytosine-specific restriction endonuclease McrA